MTALPAWRQRLAAVAVLMPHSFSVRLEPEDGCWIRAPAAVMVVHESNFHAPCCEACGKEWGKTVPTAESDPFVMVLSELHVHPARATHSWGAHGRRFRFSQVFLCTLQKTRTGDLSLIHISEPTRPY